MAIKLARKRRRPSSSLLGFPRHRVGIVKLPALSQDAGVGTGKNKRKCWDELRGPVAMLLSNKQITPG